MTKEKRPKKSKIETSETNESLWGASFSDVVTALSVLDVTPSQFKKVAASVGSSPRSVKEKEARDKRLKAFDSYSFAGARAFKPVL